MEVSALISLLISILELVLILEMIAILGLNLIPDPSLNSEWIQILKP